MQSCTRWHRAVARPAPFQPRGNARPCTPQTLHAATIKRLTIAARNSNSDTCQTTPEVSRRALLLAGALLPALSPAIPAHAAASAGSCELNAAESGLIYCDLVEGTGGVPTRGALVKWVARNVHALHSATLCSVNKDVSLISHPDGDITQCLDGPLCGSDAGSLPRTLQRSNTACAGARRVHYVATFAGSDVPFDSSYARQQPLIFKVGRR